MIENAQRALKKLERYISEIAELLARKEKVVQCLPHGRLADTEALTVANLRLTLEAMELRAARLRNAGAQATEARKAVKAKTESFQYGSPTTAVLRRQHADIGPRNYRDLDAIPPAQQRAT